MNSSQLVVLKYVFVVYTVVYILPAFWYSFYSVIYYIMPFMYKVNGELMCANPSRQLIKFLHSVLIWDPELSWQCLHFPHCIASCASAILPSPKRADWIGSYAQLKM